MAYRAICRKIDEGKMEIYWKNICFAYRSIQTHKKRPDTKTEMLTTYNEGFTISDKHDMISCEIIEMFSELTAQRKKDC